MTEISLKLDVFVSCILYCPPKNNTTIDDSKIEIKANRAGIGFYEYWNLTEHKFVSTLSSQSAYGSTNHSNSNAVIVLPLCGIASALLITIDELSDKPRFSNSSDKSLNEEDFGKIEVYGYPLSNIQPPQQAIDLLNLMTCIQYQTLNMKCNTTNWHIWMTAAECNTQCGFVLAQSRCYNQALEFFQYA